LVNKKQIESLKGILSEKTFQKQSKVILSHHHFYRNCDEAISPESKIWNKIEKFTMKLRGKKELLKIFKKADVKLVLHGHSHDFKSYERKGIHFLNAGGSLENGNNTKYKMFVIDILGDDILIEKITAGKEEKPNKTMPSFQPEPAACLQ